eukprot:COSAG04_NODE_9352_length_871_cov_1.380829_3_plen_92_part_00
MGVGRRDLGLMRFALLRRQLGAFGQVQLAAVLLAGGEARAAVFELLGCERVLDDKVATQVEKVLRKPYAARPQPHRAQRSAVNGAERRTFS